MFMQCLFAIGRQRVPQFLPNASNHLCHCVFNVTLFRVPLHLYWKWCSCAYSFYICPCLKTVMCHNRPDMQSTPHKKSHCKFCRTKKNSEDQADYALAMSICDRETPCAASSSQHQQTPCATAFSVPLCCVCCFIFMEFAPLFYVWLRKAKVYRLYKTLQNQNWHAATSNNAKWCWSILTNITWYKLIQTNINEC